MWLIASANDSPSLGAELIPQTRVASQLALSTAVKNLLNEFLGDLGSGSGAKHTSANMKCRQTIMAKPGGVVKAFDVSA